MYMPRTVKEVIHLFLCVHEAPTWLVPSGKSLKLVSPDRWKLSLANPIKNTRSAWDGFAGESY